MRILTIRDPDVGVSHEFDKLRIWLCVRFVICRENDDLTLVAHPVAKGLLRMVEHPRTNIEGTRLPLDRARPSIVDGRKGHAHRGATNVLEVDRKDGRVHLATQHRLEIGFPGLAAKELKVVLRKLARNVERAKERQSLDMIPVNVALENRATQALLLLHLGQEDLAELADARAHVTDHEIQTAADFDTGSVAAIGRAHGEWQLHELPVELQVIDLPEIYARIAK